MAREYLYKAKGVDDKWIVSNSILQSKESDSIPHKVFLWEESVGWVRVNKNTICEYTGLKDKNGTKIFEGDIVKLNDEVKQTFEVNDGVVRYGWGGFYINKFNSLHSLNTLCAYDCILRGEVIGNKFDNPELLEVKE